MGKGVKPVPGVFGFVMAAGITVSGAAVGYLYLSKPDVAAPAPVRVPKYWTR